MNLSDYDHLKRVLEGVGGSKIIYSLVMPETEAAKRRAIFGDLKAELDRTSNTAKSLTDSHLLLTSVERSMAPYFVQFREAWTQKQDRIDREYFELWRQWSNPIVQMEKDDFPFQYPTAGASEGLRALIGEYGAWPFRQLQTGDPSVSRRI